MSIKKEIILYTISTDKFIKQQYGDEFQMKTTNKDTGLNPIRIWLLAIRPKTLPAAAAPVIVGTSIALGDHLFRLGPALASLLTALLLQIGSNLANDVFDFKKGSDTDERTGPMRVTHAGLLKPNQVMIGMCIIFIMAFLVGVYLTIVGGWPILAVGILAIISAVAYTGGPFPIGYHGLGEIFVFIFFGLVAVCGTYFVQAGTINAMTVWASIPVGLLITAILVVNNLRDIATDKKAGKKTLAVRMGKKATLIEYFLLIGISYLIPLIIWAVGLTSFVIILVWLSIPMIVPLIKDVTTKQGKPLNKTLANSARLGLIYAVLFSIGYLIDKLII
jgi:1,4-dihydroxy-2-naphthoate octaprenyltransferase